ncbi:hypothetical protein D3C75_1107910 [compost metagenome]
MGQACAFEPIVAQVEAAQIGSAEIGIGEINSAGVQLPQVEAAEIAAAKVDTDVPGFFAVEAGDLFVMHQRIQCAVQLPWLIHEGASLFALRVTL